MLVNKLQHVLKAELIHHKELTLVLFKAKGLDPEITYLGAYRKIRHNEIFGEQHHIYKLQA